MAKNTHVTFPDSHHDATSNVLFGFWIYLMTDFILFAALFAVYAVLHNSTDGGHAASEFINLQRALTSTIILLCGSFASGLALLSIPTHRARTIFWFAITFLLGSAFLIMEMGDFSDLLCQGYSWKTNASFASYFTLIATHGLHIVLGLLFTLVFIAHLLLRGFTEATIRRLTCLSLFWFFSYVVWIFMFTIVYLIGAS